jgi:hemolysin activation/secretion protein
LLNQPDFAARMRALIGQPLTLPTLSGIKPLATAIFEAAGHPAVDVTIPEQDVTSGIVQVVVLEYTVGKIVVEGAEHFPQGLYRAAIRATPGQTVDMTEVQSGLKQLNASEYRSAQVALRPGSDPGTVDVVVRAQDRMPVTVSAGYNNSGAPTTGRNQWTLGASVANTVGNLDDVLSYQFLTTDFQDQAPALMTHSVTYALAIPDIGQFSMLGSYSATRPPVDDFVSSQGHSIQVSPRFTADVFTRNDLEVSVLGGYDYKSTNNNLAFGGTTITQTAANLSQFELAGIVGKGDGWGRTDATLSFDVSPGHMIPGDDDASFEGLNPAARARYGYARLDVTRVTNLPVSLTLWTHAVAQVASVGLLPSEQLNAGGTGTVRGYATSTVRGDAGLMLSNELRWAGGSVGGWLFGHDIGDRIQPFVFVDYAEVAARRSGTQPSSGGTLTSFGPGVRVNLDRYLVLALDAGGQIRVDSGRQYPAQFFDISISVSY